MLDKWRTIHINTHAHFVNVLTKSLLSVEKKINYPDILLLFLNHNIEVENIF